MPQFSLTWSDFAALAALLITVSGSNYLISQAQLATVEARLDGRMQLDSQAAQTDRDDLREDFRNLSSEISDLVRTGLEARTDEVVFALSRLGDVSDSLTVRISNMPVYSDAFAEFEQLAMASGNTGSSYQVGGVAYGSIRLSNLRDVPAYEVQRIVNAAQAESGDVRVSLELAPDSLMLNSSFSAELVKQQIDSLTAILEVIERKDR